MQFTQTFRLGKLGIGVICETQSFPRKRESTPQTSGIVGVDSRFRENDRRLEWMPVPGPRHASSVLS